MRPLPDKPSELIRVALEDLEKAEQSPLYEINMNCWHYPAGSSCLVCLAGSVLAFSMDMPPSEDYILCLPTENDSKLSALNSLRLGLIGDALTVLGAGEPPFEDRAIVEYSHSRNGFFADMRCLADDLQGVGL